MIDAALDSGDGGVLIVSEDEDDSEAGATAIVIAWLIARRAVPWAEVCRRRSNRALTLTRTRT